MIETNDELNARLELYNLLGEGLEDERNEDYQDFDEFMEEFWNEIEESK